MTNHDQQPDQPMAVPDQPTRRVEHGYQPRPRYEGYQPKVEDTGSPSKPPENPPNQGPVGRKS